RSPSRPFRDSSGSLSNISTGLDRIHFQYSFRCAITDYGISDFDALCSAVHKAPNRILFFAFDLLHLDGEDLRGQPLMDRRALLRKLIKPDRRCPIQFSDHVEGDGAKFFKAAAELGLEGIVSKRAASRYCSGRSRSWLKIKNMVEGEFVLLGTDRDANGI